MGFWFNVWDRVDAYPSLFFFMFVGQRGDGKTYGALKPLALEQRHGKFIYLRKTERTIDISCTDTGNPFKALNFDLGLDIRMEYEKKTVTIVKGQDDDKHVIGYAGALTTQGNIKGIDYSDVDYIIFDEFMEQGNRRIMKNEAFSLFNFMETVNRNRELAGREPIIVILMGNSESLDNDIIATFNLAESARVMKERGETTYVDQDRGLYFELVKGGEFAEKKKKTAIYRLTKGTEYYDFALNNNFVSDYFGNVKRIKNSDLEPIASVCEIYLYNIKSTDNIYVTSRRANCKHYTDQQIDSFKRDYGLMIMHATETDSLVYADMNIKIKLQRLFS